MKRSIMALFILSLLAVLFSGCGARMGSSSSAESAYKGNGTMNPNNDPNEVRQFLDDNHIANSDIYLKEGKVYINIVGLDDKIERLLADRYKAGTYQTVNVAHSIEELQKAQQKLIDLKLFDKLNLDSSGLDTMNNRVVITLPETDVEEAKSEIQKYINPDLLSYVVQQESVNPELVGYITKIENQRALVVNPISREINETREEFYDAIWVSNIPPDIRVGQNVQVWFKGSIETSYPGQGGASKVTISEVQKPVKAILAQDEVIRKALMNKDILDINILVIKELKYDEKSEMWTIRYKSAAITDGVLEEHIIQIPDK
ncbi:DUF3221 domain-containing protein [Paenibacillus montanisoli]|uniref:DUF3221 domain-containing protein n=1 Tax=Paenibacillus montanisoli TaxID=2081970 RepID=A0A328U2U7_9BACL|nr:DUF3221 domain-containing protein [Paenibacillus montanisoli]RAP76103.1 hypothetical protein DL346_11820 [Paenibacillus montanisoli]